MKEGRIWRNKFSIIFGILVTIILFLQKIYPSKINNYADLMSGILSLSSTATGFLFASFSLIPALPNSRLLKSLKELKTDKKFLDRILISIVGFLLCLIFALASLMFSDNNSSIYGLCIISLVGGTLTFSIAELFQVLRILFRALENM